MMVVDFAAAAFGRRRKISPPPPLGQGFGPNKIQTPALKGRPMERMGICADGASLPYAQTTERGMPSQPCGLIIAYNASFVKWVLQLQFHNSCPSCHYPDGRNMV
jgi:hypothetical protein